MSSERLAQLRLMPCAVPPHREAPACTAEDRAAMVELAVEGESRLADQMINPEELDNLLSEDSVVVLTDQYAPVDQMLAPVFRGEETQ